MVKIIVEYLRKGRTMKKNVSKFLIAVMVVAMLLGVVGCSKKGQSNSQYVGEWKSTSASASGVQVDLSALGLEMNMSLKADGNVTVSASGESGSGTWKETKTGISIDSEGKTITATNNNGKLEMVDPSSGVVMYFEKQ